MKRLAVIRVKGKTKIKRDVEDTLHMLHLTRVNHCSFIKDDAVSSGMLTKVKDYATWGEVDEETVNLLLSKRGELEGNKKLSDSHVKKTTKYGSIEEFSKAFVNFEAELDDLPSLKPFLRLHPPRGGHEGMKRSFKRGGALGPRENITGLLYKMR